MKRSDPLALHFIGPVYSWSKSRIGKKKLDATKIMQITENMMECDNKNNERNVKGKNRYKLVCGFKNFLIGLYQLFKDIYAVVFAFAFAFVFVFVIFCMNMEYVGGEGEDGLISQSLYLEQPAVG